MPDPRGCFHPRDVGRGTLHHAETVQFELCQSTCTMLKNEFEKFDPVLSSSEVELFPLDFPRAPCG